MSRFAGFWAMEKYHMVAPKIPQMRPEKQMADTDEKASDRLEAKSFTY
jgi:hypothetical protein